MTELIPIKYRDQYLILGILVGIPTIFTHSMFRINWLTITVFLISTVFTSALWVRKKKS